MNPVRKRLRLSPSKTTTNTRTGKTQPPDPPDASHNALLSLLDPPPGGEEEEGYLLVEEDATDSSLVITMEENQPEVKGGRRRRGVKRMSTEEEEETGASESEVEEEAGVEVEIDRQLDQSLETKSKQHNLTTVNVRNIIHEVITNEHVVAMMKAAINETESVPPFEPKMTRSKFKEVVEKGVVIPAWNISPIKKTSDLNKAPQFVDIPLAEEDSSDEEYHPDEEEEDETAEDTFQESDMESTASSPRGSRIRLEEDSWSPWQSSRYRSRRRRAESVFMGPPPPPQAPPRPVTDSSFLEKLHAVEEELAVCMEPYQPQPLPQPLSEVEVGLMAYRTRSKRPLRDVPLGRLEAELRAPDITPDMYDSSSAHEDRDWTDWLRGLMSSDVENEEECDDEDDPEYNFLADVDEPDKEDYRDDKAVRITKKEVNELMEELFETLKEDLAGQDLDDEGHEEEEEPQDGTHTLHTLQEQKAIGLAEAVAEDGPITELRTVKQQLAFIKKRQKQGLATQHTQIPCPEPFTLYLDARQKARLQQQLQQHVQLLTQINLLSSPVARLHSEAETTRQFLFELDLLAQRGEVLSGVSSIFRASNLQGALQLLEDLRQSPVPYQPQYHQPDALGRMRCYPVMPAELAWLFAVRPVFLYPELLPCANLDPALYCPRRTAAFTAAEDCLLVLGLRNMEGSSDPTKLVSQFLLRKSLVQVRRRILQCCKPGFPDNIVKAFRYQRVVWPMPVACGRVDPADQRPPVERDEKILPPWLARSLPVIYPPIKQFNSPTDSAPQAIITAKLTRPRRCHRTILRSGRKYSFPSGTRYPPRLPSNLDFHRIGFVLIQPPTSSHNLPAPSPPSCSLSLSVAVTDQLSQLDNRINLTPSSQSHIPPPSTPHTLPPKPCIYTSTTSCHDITQNSPRVILHRLPPAGVEEDNDSAPAATARQRIGRHYRMFASLWKMPWLPRLPLPAASGPADEEDPPGTHGKENHRPPPLSPLQSEDKSTQTGHQRRRRDDDEGPGAVPVQEGLVKEEVEGEREREEEEEEEGSEVEMPLLALSESSPSAAGSVEDLGEVESMEEEEVTRTQLLGPSLRRRGGRGREKDDDDEGPTSSDESTLSVPELQETMEKLSWLASEGTEEEEASLLSTPMPHPEEDDEDAQREMEDLVFAQDYLHRVCDALLAAPSRADWLVEVLDQFEAGGDGASPVDLYNRLSSVLQPWPQLIRDYAAFLNTAQAQRCGLLAEQRLFEHSRRFLRRLGRSLGEGSSHYQDVVSVLQGSPAPGPDDMKKISTLLKDHADLQEEFWEFFNQLHTQPTPVANSISQNTPNRTRKRNRRSKSKQTREPESRTGSDGEEGEEEDEYSSLSSDRPVCAKNIFLSSTGEKVILWTREADRAILTACQQRGANQKTFQLVSAQLGNKTAKQISSRFQDLMSLFRSATQKPTSCSVEDHPISSQEAAPD